MKTESNQPSLIVTAIIRAKAGKETDLKQALVAMVAPTHREAGCLNYELHQDLEDPALFVFHENWTSKAHLDAHLASPHLNTFRAQADDLLAGPPKIMLAKKLA